MNLKIRKIKLFEFFRDKRGFAQIPLMIGLLIMAVAVPAATKMVQESQDKRSSAATPITYTCTNGKLGSVGDIRCGSSEPNSKFTCSSSGWGSGIKCPSNTQCKETLSNGKYTATCVSVPTPTPQARGNLGNGAQCCPNLNMLEPCAVGYSCQNISTSRCGTCKPVNSPTPTPTNLSCSYAGKTYANGVSFCNGDTTMKCNNGKVETGLNCANSNIPKSCSNGNCVMVNITTPTPSITYGACKTSNGGTDIAGTKCTASYTGMVGGASCSAVTNGKTDPSKYCPTGQVCCSSVVTNPTFFFYNTSYKSCNSTVAYKDFDTCNSANKGACFKTQSECNASYSPCTSAGGTCGLSTSCSGSILNDKCPGDSTIKCCIPTSSYKKPVITLASAVNSGSNVIITVSALSMHHAAVSEGTNFVGNMKTSIGSTAISNVSVGGTMSYTVSLPSNGSHTYTIKVCSVAAVNNSCPDGAWITKDVSVTVGTISIIQDAACKNKGGVCQNTTSSCSGTYTTGDCPSSGSTVKCCAPKAIVTPIPTTTVYKKPIFYVGVSLNGADVFITITGTNIHHAAVLEGSTFIGNMSAGLNYTVKAPSIGNHTYSVKACSVAAVNNECPVGASTTVSAATINVVSTVTEVSCPSICSNNFGCMKTSTYTGLGSCTKPKDGTISYTQVSESVCPKVGDAGLSAGGNNDACLAGAIVPVISDISFSGSGPHAVSGQKIKLVASCTSNNCEYMSFWIDGKEIKESIVNRTTISYEYTVPNVGLGTMINTVVKGCSKKADINGVCPSGNLGESKSAGILVSNACRACKSNPNAGYNNFMCKSSLNVLDIGTWVTEMANFTETVKPDWKSDMNCDSVVNALDLPFIKSKFNFN